MHWLFVISQAIGELTLTTLVIYCLCYVLYWLHEFVNLSLPRRRVITLVTSPDSMCDQCKKKDADMKRAFKSCNHTYCTRCFLSRCTQLCPCEDCRSAHFECHLCRRRK